MSDTPPSIPPRKGDAGDKSAGGRTATEQAERSATSTGKGSSGTGTSTRATPAAKSSGSSSAPAKGAAATTATPAASGGNGRTSTATAATATQEPARGASAASSASGASTSGTARPAVSSSLAGSGPRRVRLAVSRVDPWSVMKLSFLMSVAIGIMIVVATAVVWLTLDSLHVFASINDLVEEILADSDINLMKYVEFDRVLSIATLVAVVDIFLITALATIGAFLYNITAALVGGVHVTMTDE